MIDEQGMKIMGHCTLARLQGYGVLRALPGVPLVVEGHAAKEHQLLAPKNIVEFHCKRDKRRVLFEGRKSMQECMCKEICGL